VRSGLRRVKHCAAMASPRHVPPVAGAPDRTHRPASVAVVVAGGAARRRHHDPALPRGHEVTDKVVGEFGAAWIGHGDVVPQTADTPKNGVSAPCAKPFCGAF
jgi:hypothetical protein